MFLFRHLPPMEIFRNIPAITARSAEEWRMWLKENHQKVENVWLIIFKKETGIATVTYKDSVDEALCLLDRLARSETR